MTVEKFMTKNVRTCCETGTLADAAQLLWEADCGCIPVLSADDSNRVVGIVTDRDICMATHFRGSAPGRIAVADVMSTVICSVSPSASVADAEALMRDAQVRRLPVVDSEQKLVGVVSLADLARGTNGRAKKDGPTTKGVSETFRAISAPRAAVTAAAPVAKAS